MSGEAELPGFHELGRAMRVALYGMLLLGGVAAMATFTCWHDSSDQLLDALEAVQHQTDVAYTHVRHARAERDAEARSLADSLTAITRASVRVDAAVQRADSAQHSILLGRDTALAGDTTDYVTVRRVGDTTAYPVPVFVVQAFALTRQALDSAVLLNSRYERAMDIAKAVLESDREAFAAYDDLVVSMRGQVAIEGQARAAAHRAGWRQGFRVGAVVGAVVVVVVVNVAH